MIFTAYNDDYFVHNNNNELSCRIIGGKNLLAVVGLYNTDAHLSFILK